jgi:ATP-dependent DNA helicase RecG
VDGASVNDLDIPLIQTISENFLRGISVEHYLQQVGLAEYAPGALRLRRAALLLFATDITRWHPRSQVRILKVRGNELKSGEQYNVAADEIAQGNVFQLLQSSWDRLRPFLTFATEFGRDARFEQRYLYPESACREALVNAIAHRAYNNARGVEVFVFDDRMEIRSPGSLLSTLTLDGLRKLTGAHESRNTLVARVLRENRFMRELGEGIKRIFLLMEENELEEPRLASDDAWFTITLPHRSVFSPQQEQWASMFAGANLTGLQKKVVILGMEGREISKEDIVRAINTRDRDTYDKAVTPLRNAGILQQIRTNPQASQYARTHHLRKDQVPRFKVVSTWSPGQTPTTASTASPSQPPHFAPRTEAGSVSRTRRPAPGAPSRQVPDERCCVFFRFPTSAETLTKEEVVRHFAGHGRIKDVQLPTIPRSDVQKGFGFVWFDNPQSAENAIRTLDGSFIGRRRLALQRYATAHRQAGQGEVPSQEGQ